MRTGHAQRTVSINQHPMMADCTESLFMIAPNKQDHDYSSHGSVCHDFVNYDKCKSFKTGH